MAFTLLMGTWLMSSKFPIVDRDTLYLLPPSVEDWLPDDHLARFVVDTVDRLDLNALERATYDSVAFRFIAANSHPDHDTIASFRKRFLAELQGLFVQILLIAQEMGMLKLGNVSLDGTKVRTNAGKHKALSWRFATRLEEQLRAEVTELLARAARADDAEPELDTPEELKRRTERLAVIEAAQAEIVRRAQERYEAEQADYEEKLAARREKEKRTGREPGGRPPAPPTAGPRDSDQVNLTDAESRIMPSANGFAQAYNAQSGVAIELVVPADVVDRCNDKRELASALKELGALPAALGKPVGLLADTGYFSRENVAHCEAAGMTPHIATGREAQNVPLAERCASPPPCPEDADPVTRMAHRLQPRRVGHCMHGANPPWSRSSESKRTLWSPSYRASNRWNVFHGRKSMICENSLVPVYIQPSRRQASQKRPFCRIYFQVRDTQFSL